MGVLIRVVVTAFALWVSTIVPGIDLGADTFWKKVGTLLAVAVIFGLVNVLIKPVIKVVGCLFYLLTFGLIAFVINALLFLLVSWIAGKLDLPFHVSGFWAAFWGSLIVSLVAFGIEALIGTRGESDRRAYKEGYEQSYRQGP